MSIRLFEQLKHAKIYSIFRPTYPNELYEFIYTYCTHRDSSGSQVAVDVGCGSGQSTLPLKNYFSNVIGIDISEEQIEEAKRKCSGIDFKVSPGENLGFLKNETVDLVTIATAIHWLDKKKLYEETTRVLKPGGALIVYGYGVFTVEEKEAQHMVMKVYHGLLGNHWDRRVREAENLYRTYTLPFEGWERNDDTFSIQKEMSVDSVIGYMSSLSAWQLYQSSNPDSEELEILCKKLKAIYTEGTTEHTMKVTWQIGMLLGRKPR